MQSVPDSSPGHGAFTSPAPFSAHSCVFISEMQKRRSLMKLKAQFCGFKLLIWDKDICSHLITFPQFLHCTHAHTHTYLHPQMSVRTNIVRYCWSLGIFQETLPKQLIVLEKEATVVLNSLKIPFLIENCFWSCSFGKMYPQTLKTYPKYNSREPVQ